VFKDAHTVDEAGPFDLARRLQEVLLLGDQECPGDDLLLQSPLTSLESTPESSPIPKHMALPDVGKEHAPLPRASSPATTNAPSRPSAPNKSERVMKRNREQSRKNARKRSKSEKESGCKPPELRKNAEAKYSTNANALFTPMATKNAPVASTGYIALNRPLGQKKAVKDMKDYTMSEMKELGFEYIKWDGE